MNMPRITFDQSIYWLPKVTILFLPAMENIRRFQRRAVSMALYPSLHSPKFFYFPPMSAEPEVTPAMTKAGSAVLFDAWDYLEPAYHNGFDVTEIMVRIFSAMLDARPKVDDAVPRGTPLWRRLTEPPQP